MTRYLVTSALPYANGPIHFGHVVGAYLPADIYVRYLRMKGEKVMFVCGTDEHGVAITINAEQAKTPYKEFVDRWHGEIKKTFDRFGIEFDIFSGTARNPLHANLSQHFFRRLHKNGYVFTQTIKQLYCLKDQMFLADRYLEGICPYCGAPDARGDECKKCGQWIDALQLKEPRCKTCGTTPEVRETMHWYLDLPKLYRDGVGKWFEDNPAWKSNVKSFVANMLKDLQPRPITRDLRWGVPVPQDFEGGDGKVLYVWFDAPIGYVSNTALLCEEHPEKWGTTADWWQSPDTRLIHFIGKDNIPFHCVVFPSMLFGAKEGYCLPWNVPANEFYNLQGRKFSTSGGWFLDMDDFFSKYSADAARYSLIANGPETADSEFTWEEFQRRNNGELADTIGNLASRLLKFVEQKFQGAIPSAEPDPTIRAAQENATREMGKAFENFQFRKACQELDALARFGNQAFDTAKPWASVKSNPDQCAKDLGQLYELLWSIAVLSHPILPTASTKLAEMMGLSVDWKTIRWEDAAKPSPRTKLQKLGKIDVLFPKIEDKQIEEEIRLLHARAEGKEKMTEIPTTSNEKIFASYEDFQKIELRVGKVLSAAPVPKANKLLHLEVDLGSEKRQILSGIAQQYTPESLIGKSVIVVANLAPKKMMGIESQGMILAGTGPEGPVLVFPEKEIPPGSIVK